MDNKTTDAIYDVVKANLQMKLKALEADYRQRFGDGWKDYYAAELEARLMEKSFELAYKGMMLDLAEKKYDALLEREHGDGGVHGKEENT